MALVLDLPDDIVLNYVLLFIGDVQSLLSLRSVSKKFNQKIEILLLAIVELDLIQIDFIKSQDIYLNNIAKLEAFNDMKKMLEFRLERLFFDKEISEIDEFDYYIGQGLAVLARNCANELAITDLGHFLKNSLKKELSNIFLFRNSTETRKKAEEECLKALAVDININKQQRRLLDWLTGALKLFEMMESLHPNFKSILNSKSKVEFFKSRVIQISKFFGISI
jgi:hypothetical protein